MSFIFLDIIFTILDLLVIDIRIGSLVKIYNLNININKESFLIVLKVFPRSITYGERDRTRFYILGIGYYNLSDLIKITLNYKIIL